MMFEPISLSELLAADVDEKSVEAAYRRGVHHALSFMADYLRDMEFVEAARVCGLACDAAGVIRYNNQPCPLLMDELSDRTDELVYYEKDK